MFYLLSIDNDARYDRMRENVREKKKRNVRHG